MRPQPQAPGPPELEYEPSISGRPVLVERDGGVVRITVKRGGLYAPVPKWVSNLEWLALFEPAASSL